jgi:hypothetical protein
MTGSAAESATQSGGVDSLRDRAAVAGRIGLPFTLLVVALLSYAVITARAFPTEQAKFFPLAIGIPALVMAVLQLLTDLGAVFKGGRVQAEILDIGGDDAERMSSPRAPLLAWAWFLGFMLLIYVVGLSIAIVLFTPLYLWLAAKAKLVQAILGTVALWGVIVGVLHHVLLLDAPRGLVFGG